MKTRGTLIAICVLLLSGVVASCKRNESNQKVNTDSGVAPTQQAGTDTSYVGGGGNVTTSAVASSTDTSGTSGTTAAAPAGGGAMSNAGASGVGGGSAASGTTTAVSERARTEPGRGGKTPGKKP